ncbi:MAG TPA: 4Fe-4S dicluster domain-containing protein [Candidatus Choladousia intestinavium]|uniref:4Fe-4S dicluster domain-containing protein n=1 Tax=Candidatus Choladousia intestinavium TaxID=2840727 RepID=A0A9D1AB68_9FIRM|nr:4Fe-4S dicluster domain-containing protein [Candidatus Choladousia intestinavium]
MYKIAKEHLPALFRKIAGSRELYLPVKTAGQVNFAPWEETAAADLETLKTVKSPKDLFFPQCETLYTCRQEGGSLSVEPETLKEQEFVVFGMRSCDARGLEILDKVFLTEPHDSFYEARRKRGTLVVSACPQPEETCFCSVFGIDCAEPKGDAAVWPVGEELYWKPLTSKGEALTELVRELLLETGDREEALEEEKAKIREIVKQLPYAGLSLEGWGEERLLERFHSKKWEELYRPCLACGTCTFVCPTCQCYDIKDYDTGQGVKRYRCWDSCMYSDFTMMAHGNNRTSQMQRFRQRFMHKLVYYPANYDGIYSCVGCGRCVQKCPVSLNIVKVIRAFSQGEAPEGGGKNA